VQGPAPIAVLAGCVLTGLSIAAKGSRSSRLALGLLLGFGFEAAVKGLSLLGEGKPSITAGAWLWIVGGFVVVAGGIVSLVPLPRVSAKSLHVPFGVTLVLLAGAALMVVGASIPFNVDDGANRIIVGQNWWCADPIGTAVGVVIAAALLYGGLRSLAAGILIAIGIASLLLWARYIGVPLLQWIDVHGQKGKPEAGGFVGAAGAFLVLLTGWALARTSRVREPSAGPTYPVPA
jgi:hypothetical protein